MNLPNRPYFPPLVVGEKEFAFSHLEPIGLVVPTKGKLDGVRIDVLFSNHCFSESFDPAIHTGEVVDVWDGGRRRVFDRVRYDLSAALPGIVEGLPGSPVFRTPEANFVRITAPPGAPGVDYRMFFRIGRAEKGASYDLRMRVESAYSPTAGQAVPPKDMTKIGFAMLVDKTLRGERISAHYKR